MHTRLSLSTQPLKQHRLTHELHSGVLQSWARLSPASREGQNGLWGTHDVQEQKDLQPAQKRAIPAKGQTATKISLSLQGEEERAQAWLGVNENTPRGVQRGGRSQLEEKGTWELDEPAGTGGG